MKRLLFMLLATQVSSCQNKEAQNQPTEKKQTKEMQLSQERKTTFQWEEGLNAPQGYPIEVYRGGLELAAGFVGLSGLGTTTGFGGWGANGNGMSHGVKSLPKHINCIWLSYAEDCMYKINCDVDYEKIVQLFNEGFVDSNRKRGRQMDTYDSIMTGFAPGGVVVIWVAGGDKKVEIGRYQGEKTTVSAQEIASLDSHERLLFDSLHRKEIMKYPKIVSPDVQKANENKPIPFGLWDTYREKYSWRPVFIFPEYGKMIDRVRIEKMNGEFETLMYEEFYDNDFKQSAIPRRFSFGWWDKKGQGYGASVSFDENEILAAYAEMFKKDRNANVEIHFKINKINTYFSVTLENGTMNFPLIKNNIEVFQSRTLTKQYKKE
jgi:hypothetical protein